MTIAKINDGIEIYYNGKGESLTASNGDELEYKASSLEDAIEAVKAMYSSPAWGLEIIGKAWYLIDDRTEYGAICTEERLNAATQAEAVAEAWREWNRMTQFDRNTTTDYFVAYAEEEDGILDWDSMTDIVTIKGLDPEAWGLE